VAVALETVKQLMLLTPTRYQAAVAAEMVKDTAEWLAARDIYLDTQDNLELNIMLMGEQVIQAAAAFTAARVLLLAALVEMVWLAVAAAAEHEAERVSLELLAARVAQDFILAAVVVVVEVVMLLAAVLLAVVVVELLAREQMVAHPLVVQTQELQAQAEQ
jgi:hypothetical protein